MGRNDAYASALLVSLKLDCVVFAEGMNEAMIYFLAFQRFAPVQILVMGAPVSSGISSIDYFISGDRLEHPFRTQISGDMEHLEHYSEQVVFLMDKGCVSLAMKFTQDRVTHLLLETQSRSNLLKMTKN